MKQNQASHTAEYMALFRALENFRPSNVRLFEDRFALEFLTPSLRTVARMSRYPFFSFFIPWPIDWRWPGARSSGIARTRFIDDALLKILQEGIQQVVILGSGFDCRAYRIPGIDRTHVYEVDYPNTLAAKRQHLKRVLGRLPQHAVFAEIDFNQQQLKDILLVSGFDPTCPSCFIWEGVTNYLTKQAVDATLQFISTTAAGNQIIFTYVHQGVLDNSDEFEGTRNLMRLLQEDDEPWTFGLYPSEITEYLMTRGFQLLEDIGSIDYRARYMGQKGRHLHGYEFYRIARACVVRSSVTKDGISRAKRTKSTA